MHSRTPTKAEKIFVRAAIQAVGCYACYKLGHENDYLEEQLSIHHNPDKGSRDKYCHFFSVPLCGVHHQGAVPPGMKLPAAEPVRHSALGATESNFKLTVGDDLQISYAIWEKISLDAQDAIGELTGIYNFFDLVKCDGELRNAQISK